MLHHEGLHAPTNLRPILTALLVHCSNYVHPVLFLQQPLLAVLTLELVVERLYAPVVLGEYTLLLACFCLVWVPLLLPLVVLVVLCNLLSHYWRILGRSRLRTHSRN